MAATAKIISEEVIDVCFCGKHWTAETIQYAPKYAVTGSAAGRCHWWECDGVNGRREPCRSGRCAIERGGVIEKCESVKRLNAEVSDKRVVSMTDYFQGARTALDPALMASVVAEWQKPHTREEIAEAARKIKEHCDAASDRAGETEAVTLEMLPDHIRR